MANTNAPFGFSQYMGTGSAPTYEMVTGLIAYNTANIFYGDPVFRGNDGTYQGITFNNHLFVAFFVDKNSGHPIIFILAG